jgi:hypothetical protein
MKIFLIFLILNCSLVFAGTGKILALRGTATFNGSKLKLDQSLEGKGEFIVGEKSYLKILLVESDTVIAMGSDSVSRIDFSLPSQDQELNLVKGISRWVTGKVRGKGMKTRNTAAGVRGTDFLMTYNPALGETEIICFDGRIQLVNASDVTDSRLISKNQWGGLGGRFGQKLANVLNLGPELISTFDKLLPK